MVRRKTGWRGASAANEASGLAGVTYALVELTAAGQAVCHELDAIARAANDQLLDGFSDDETAQLKNMLQRLAKNAGKLS